MFFAAIWLDHWATGDGSLCLDLRHVWKCMDGVFFFNGRSEFIGHDDSMHLQLGLNGKYMSVLFYTKIYLYHPSPSFTYYLSSLSIYILYHTLSTIYTIILFIIILYLLFDTRQNRKHHIISHHVISLQVTSAFQQHAISCNHITITQTYSTKHQPQRCVIYVCHFAKRGIPHFGLSPHYPSLWSVPSLSLTLVRPWCVPRFAHVVPAVWAVAQGKGLLVPPR